MGTLAAQSIEIGGHTTATIRDAVDFYYDNGFLINVYGHSQTDQVAKPVQYEYVTYTAGKMTSLTWEILLTYKSITTI